MTTFPLLPHPVSLVNMTAAYQFPNSSFTFRSHLAPQTVLNNRDVDPENKRDLETK